MNDYLTHYGDSGIAGLNYEAATSTTKPGDVQHVNVASGAQAVIGPVQAGDRGRRGNNGK